ncbi:hypothetical protein BKA04_001321 [Cryobacterium mesophilum]|uniref:Uncharacterized protein n=1 Tax=Terrimesophilobacter mesophilus TaxID=433647 RepID=A0A4R8VBS9_9MICO|nr:DUF6049 family protein [Terrimesophilobacter mesophilus]MBB5633098.1 hypothetical protein [Terrimesophilobacter mesophilus]TFB79856.1 hypothetical protein E3N84_07245 [Terrimesophilobacter mesophilus]
MRLIPFLLALGLAVGGAAVPAAPAPIDDGGVTIVAAASDPTGVHRGQALRVSGTITNSSKQAMDAGTATVYLSTIPLTTRASVEHWLASDDSDADQSLGAAVATLAIGELAPGQVRSFTLSVPPSSVKLPGGGIGVFPAAVRLSTGSVVLDTSRSVVVGVPTDTEAQVKLAIATSIVAPSTPTGLLDAATLETLTAPGGMLYRELDVALEHPVAIGVDPMIVASIRLLGDTASESARDWLLRLESASNDLFLLPYADADPVLERQAGARTPLVPLSFPIDGSRFPEPPSGTAQPTDPAAPPATGIPTAQDLVALPSAIDGIAWPAGTVTEKDLDFLAAGGYSRTIVPSSNLTALPVSSPNVTIGSHALTVSDAEVSELLGDAAGATNEGEWAHAASSLAGVLAVTAAHSPGATVFAALDRYPASSATRLGASLSAIESLPWVASTALGEALALPAAKAKLASVDPGTDRVALSARMLESEQDTTSFSSVANDPALITGPQRLALLSLFSSSTVADPASWESAADAFLQQNDALRSSVHIPESSTINFPQEKGNLPIAVRNELDVPVTVYVTVQPERAILDVLNTRVKLTIEANSQAKASVPVQSIANGEVLTRVSLSSGTGAQISMPTYVVLNVQAGWEAVLTVILAVIVVILFAAGIWRTVLRRRRARAQRLESSLPETEGGTA